MSKTAIILLAAGRSERMGSPKQLLTFCGQPLLRHVTAVACCSGWDPVIVVLGAREGEMRTVLSGLPVEITVNQRWSEGMGTSIQAGLQALGDREVDGAILALADQPFVTAEFLSRLGQAHALTGKRIVASRYSGTVGVPAFFARDAFQELNRLKPDQGCKGVLLAHAREALFIDCPEAAIDIDTPEDYAETAGFR